MCVCVWSKPSSPPGCGTATGRKDFFPPTSKGIKSFFSLDYTSHCGATSSWAAGITSLSLCLCILHAVLFAFHMRVWYSVCVFFFLQIKSTLFADRKDEDTSLRTSREARRKPPKEKREQREGTLLEICFRDQQELSLFASDRTR